MIEQMNQVNATLAASIPLVLPMMEMAIRLIPSKRPLSFMHLASGVFHGLGDLCTTVAGALDAVVPQKLAAPAAPVAQGEAPAA